jgi:hypothetical protein
VEIRGSGIDPIIHDEFSVSSVLSVAKANMKKRTQFLANNQRSFPFNRAQGKLCSFVLKTYQEFSKNAKIAQNHARLRESVSESRISHSTTLRACPELAEWGRLKTSGVSYFGTGNLKKQTQFHPYGREDHVRDRKGIKNDNTIIRRCDIYVLFRSRQTMLNKANPGDESKMSR